MQLQLPHGAYVTGDPIHAVVVFKNASEGPVKIAEHKCMEDPGLAVGLTNRHVSFEPAFTAEACGPDQWLEPGLTRFDVTIQTTSSNCLPVTVQGVDHPSAPTCLPDGNNPGLPVGRYQTKIVWIGAPHGTVYPQPASIDLQPLPRS